MARHTDTMTWLFLAGGAGLAYYLYQQGVFGAPAAATPLSIYPEYGYTATTSMASTPNQKNTAAVIPTSSFTSVQAEEQAAVLSQCAGSYPGCTVLLGDTQLGF